MDKSLFLALSGAVQTMNAQAVHANNLANVSTTGFKTDLEQARSMQVFGSTFPSRVYAMIEEPSTDTSAGVLNTTGNPLDVAINGPGWLAVQAADGSEAYTRAGDFSLGTDGLLRNGGGFVALAANGKPLVLPGNAINVAVGGDGTVSYQTPDSGLAGTSIADSLKLVQLKNNDLHKGTDGLMRLPGGSKLPATDPTVRVVSGAVETSNVSAVGELSRIIELSRQFEMQVKFMQDAQSNDQYMARILQTA